MLLLSKIVTIIGMPFYRFLTNTESVFVKKTGIQLKSNIIFGISAKN